jgi:hypothetical protein
MAVDHYAELHAAHRWEVPARFNIAHACCGRWAEDRTRFALYWEDESGSATAHTFWDLQREADRLSNVLVQLGVQRGDKVALVLPQRRETAVAHIAIYQMGAVAVPLSFLFGPTPSGMSPRRFGRQGRAGRPQSLPNLTPIRGIGAETRGRRGRCARRRNCDVRNAGGRSQPRFAPVDAGASGAIVTP